MQPGSFFNGKVQCGTNKCIVRSKQAQKQHTFYEAFAITTGERECLGCTSERRKRQLVANVATDPRFTNNKTLKRHRCLHIMISSMK